MRNRFAKSKVFHAAAVALICSAASAEDTPPGGSVIVYESATSRAGGGHGFVAGVYEMGQSITLAGTERTIAQLDLLLSGRPGEDEFRVRFYRLDNATGAPSTLIWESPTQTYRFVGSLDRTTSVRVPDIELPDSFAYTIISLTPNSYLSHETGSSIATIGTFNSYWYRRGDATWRDRLFRDGTFGARVFAIPEPFLGWTITGLIAISLMIGSFRLRRRKPS
jgi:hypothetical protein